MKTYVVIVFMATIAGAGFLPLGRSMASAVGEQSVSSYGTAEDESATPARVGSSQQAAGLVVGRVAKKVLDLNAVPTGPLRRLPTEVLTSENMLRPIERRMKRLTAGEVVPTDIDVFDRVRGSELAAWRMADAIKNVQAELDPKIAEAATQRLRDAANYAVYGAYAEALERLTASSVDLQSAVRGSTSGLLPGDPVFYVPSGTAVASEAAQQQFRTAQQLIRDYAFLIGAADMPARPRLSAQELDGLVASLQALGDSRTREFGIEYSRLRTRSQQGSAREYVLSAIGFPWLSALKSKQPGKTIGMERIHLDVLRATTRPDPRELTSILEPYMDAARRLAPSSKLSVYAAVDRMRNLAWQYLDSDVLHAQQIALDSRQAPLKP